MTDAAAEAVTTGRRIVVAEELEACS